MTTKDWNPSNTSIIELALKKLIANEEMLNLKKLLSDSRALIFPEVYEEFHI